jgi:hypothetical protein
MLGDRRLANAHESRQNYASFVAHQKNFTTKTRRRKDIIFILRLFRVFVVNYFVTL